MHNFILIFIVLVVSCLPAEALAKEGKLLVVSCLAEQTFKDLPEKHWAEEQVSLLVKLGVTNGYPDGTFRGREKVTREQIASFIDKLAEKSKVDPGLEKIVAELKTEFNIEKFKLEYPGQATLTGNLSGNFLLSQGREKTPATNYRTKFQLKRKFDKNNRISISFDTMDLGYNGAANRSFARELVDLEGNFKFGEIAFATSFGGGDRLHLDPLIPASSGTVFRRKKPSVTAAVAKNHTKMTGGFTVLNQSENGQVNTKDFFVGLGYTFQKLPLLGRTSKTVRLHYVKNAEKDLRAELEIEASPNKDVNLRLDLGIGNGEAAGLYVGGQFSFWALKIGAHRIGSSFRTAGLNKYDYLPLNPFGKYMLDGTTDLSLIYSHPIKKNIELKILYDAVLSWEYKYGKDYPGTSQTCEIDLVAGINQSANAILFYKNFSVPSGINYVDPAIAETVPISSDMLGLGLELEL